MAGSIRWWTLFAVATPAPPVTARGGEPAAGRARASARPSDVSTPTGHEPPCTAMSPPALTSAGPAARQQLGRALCRVALADPAEVETDAGAELDPRAVDRGPRPPQTPRRRSTAVPSSGSCSNVRSYPARDDGVVDGRVEAPVGPPACLERELGRPRSRSGPTSSEPRLVQPGELGLGPEAREDRLEPVELAPRRRHSASSAPTASTSSSISVPIALKRRDSITRSSST